MAKPTLSGGGADLFVTLSGKEKIVRRVPTKAFWGRKLSGEAKFESNLLSLIGNQDFSAKFISSDSKSLTYGYVKGREPFYSADGAKMGKALAHMHDYTTKNPPKFIDYVPAEAFIISWLGALKKGENLPTLSKIAEESLAKLSPMPFAKSKATSGCLVHNHLTLRNAVVDEKNAVRLVDFSWAQHSDAVLDMLSFTSPASTCSEYEHFISEGQQRDFFKAYFEERKLASSEKDAMLSKFSSLCVPYCALIFLYSRTGDGAHSLSPSSKKLFSDESFIIRAISEAKRISDRKI